MTWRLVPLETRDPYLNMGLDQALMEAAASGDAPPTLRLYRWDPPTVSIGRYQSLERQVDLEECGRRGVEHVRRITGGGAVYHAREVTYSLAAPEEELSGGVTETYREVCGAIADALDRFGIEAEFQPVNDVVTGGRKVSGSAQTRRDGAVLQHGTVILELDAEEMFSILTPDAEKVDDKAVEKIEDRVTSVNREAEREVTERELADALRNSLLDDRDWEQGELATQELERARELARKRYGNRGWSFER